ncbi:MAG: hypothetical protein DCF25_16520 [Leptolyngbya foveolarum]|uniref:Uncharacterized protein n=1 Tax=Leptolyngbya foveolarum TaxID=47253 RepID=A0A2W4TWL9_9CYAN|nr:MAG: hypothetical protein DCF25_16520 [Leptolyngbya foveolarum]
MVAIFGRKTNQENSTACGFSYLKPIAKKLPKPKSRRWLNAVWTVAHVGAIAGAFWLAQVPGSKQAPIESVAEAGGLYEAVGMPEYLAFAEAYEKQQTAALIAEAQQKSERADELMALASYEAADSILGYRPGQEIKTTTLVKVTCDQGLQGETATVRQIEGKYQDGVLRNLESCNAGVLQPGDAIGIAGKYQASLENLP